jgi:hypothetical protein
MISNLGFYDEKLPSIKTVNDCKNFLQLHVAQDVLDWAISLDQTIKTGDNLIKKKLRAKIGMYDRALNVHKKLHFKENKTMWALFLGLGFIIGFLCFPCADFMWRSFIKLIS